LGAPRIHFTGTLLFAKDERSPPEPADVPEAAETLAAAAVYERFFHGPSFQVLGTLAFAEDPAVAVGTYAWPAAEAVVAGDAALVTSPRVRELAFQAAGGHELFKHGHLSLPRRVGRGRFYGTPEAGETVVAVATYKRVNGAVATYDVTVQTEAGRVLEVLEDFELIRTEEAAKAAADPAGGVETYRTRWGHDLPVPLEPARAVLVNDEEVNEGGLKPEACLTEGEREDQERYRNDKRAREFFLGRLAAKEAVALILERPVSEARGVEIRRLEGGQPEVQSAQAKDVLVTISHQGPYAVALAVRKDARVKAVGIDFDRIELKSSGFESESFTDGERSRLDALVDQGRDRAELQVVFWTVKEAVLKALGKGFALDLHSVEIQRLDGDVVLVSLRGDAAACLDELGASNVQVQSWTRDNYAYALAWLN
jgi:phosphopantetheinyl transferase